MLFINKAVREDEETYFDCPAACLAVLKWHTTSDNPGAISTYKPKLFAINAPARQPVKKPVMVIACFVKLPRLTVFLNAEKIRLP
ncbi:MAG: hypothetical protein JWQ57_2832, partial [Mucilaginibacter sp.]|nr:hypothetical protein [Mucilaginibacter sp.]